MATMNQLDALRFALSTIDPDTDAYEVISGMIETRERAAARPKKPSKSSLRNAELIAEVVVPFVNERGVTTARTLANECGDPEVSGSYVDVSGNHRTNSAKAAALLKRAATEGLIVSFRETKNSVTLYATTDYDVDAHLERVAAERTAKALARAERAAERAKAKADAAAERVSELSA